MSSPHAQPGRDVRRIFAGCLEAPGEVIEIDGKLYKHYRGMGSLAAMRAGAAARYGHTRDTSRKVAAEGVEALKESSGSVDDVLTQLIAHPVRDGLLGAANLGELRGGGALHPRHRGGRREAAPMTSSKSAPAAGAEERERVSLEGARCWTALGSALSWRPCSVTMNLYRRLSSRRGTDSKVGGTAVSQRSGRSAARRVRRAGDGAPYRFFSLGQLPGALGECLDPAQYVSAVMYNVVPSRITPAAVRRRLARVDDAEQLAQR